MFTGPLTGDDNNDPTFVSKGELALSLLSYATNVSVGQTNTTATQALTASQGNATVMAALDQRITAELSAKLEAHDLSPYALEATVVQLGIQAAATTAALQTAQLATGTLQSSVSNSLALKADQAALEAVHLTLAEKASITGMEAALLPYATSTQVYQSVALAKAEVQALAAASYGTRAEVTIDNRRRR